MTLSVPNLTLVLGGTRSGKSQFAETLASSYGPNVLYVATAEIWPGDGSMAERIRRHRERRPATWRTLECPRRVAETLTGAPELLVGRDAAMLDCLTLWLANLAEDVNKADVGSLEQAMERELDALLNAVAASAMPWIVVSSETGLGLVAPDPSTRVFCDALGLANQKLAAAAGTVVLTVAGLPVTLKGVVR